MELIGIVIVTHGDLGKEMLRTAENIASGKLYVKTISVDNSKDSQLLLKHIKKTIKESDAGQGVLVLTDLFGGTPSNICISLMNDHAIEVVSGVNLPMLINIPTVRYEEELKKAAILIKEYGKKNISIAGDILRQETAK